MAKNILITNYEISQYSGSEINAATIAKRMKKMGYTVYMAGLNFDGPLYTDTKDCFDVCINLQKDYFDFSKIEFDYIWSHHFFLLDWLIFEKNVRARKILYSSLSGKEYFEASPIYANELNLVLANSPETNQQLILDGINNIRLFENYSFEEYFKRNIKVEKLKKIAIVSNHIPEELRQATELLRQEGYCIDIYGIEGKQELITDKVLEKYDLIITIGKTVQYAMSLKIPVYIYDRFGGPGYLKMSNMEQNRAHNFSGRSYEKRSAEELAKDIVEGFSQTIKELDNIKEYAFNNFCFEKNLDLVIKQLESQEEVNLEKIRNEYSKYSRNLLASKNLMIYIKRKANQEKEKEKDQVAFDYINANERKTQELKNKIADLEKVNFKLNKELANIKKSKSWKIISKFRRLKK